MPKSDPQAERPLAHRPDIFPDYTEEAFERAFTAVRRVRRRVPLRDSARVLYLFDAA